jgi:hypothetical protein
MRFWLLTFILVGLLGLAGSYIKISFPTIPEYAKFEILDGKKIFDINQHLKKYDRVQNSVLSKQLSLRNAYKVADTLQKINVISQTRTYLQDVITQELLPFWDNTPWDFNGTTTLPRSGTIACGYFVTTVLCHARLDIDRYRWGQSSSGALIGALCEKNSIEMIRRNNFKRFLKYFYLKPDGIYLVGLDAHIGFLEKRGEKLTFIHSRKPRTIGVIREKAQDSPTLQKSDVYVIGNLLLNDEIIKKWLAS